MSYRKYILQITHPSQSKCSQLQYKFAVISEAPSMYLRKCKTNDQKNYTDHDYWCTKPKDNIVI